MVLAVTGVLIITVVALLPVLRTSSSETTSIASRDFIMVAGCGFHAGKLSEKFIFHNIVKEGEEHLVENRG